MKTVETGYTNISYFIRESNLADDGHAMNLRYDWVLTGGMESDEYFKTIEEARKDVQTYFE